MFRYWLQREEKSSISGDWDMDMSEDDRRGIARGAGGRNWGMLWAAAKSDTLFKTGGGGVVLRRLALLKEAEEG